MEAKPLGDITPVSPLDFVVDDDASSVESPSSQQVHLERLVSLRQTRYELAWQALEEQMRPRAVVPGFPCWLGPSSLRGTCFQGDFQMGTQDAQLTEAMQGLVQRCSRVSSQSVKQETDGAYAVLIRPLSSYECKRDIARHRRVLEKLSISGTTAAVQLQRVYADLHEAYLVFRLPGDGQRISQMVPPSNGRCHALQLTQSVLQALSQVHAAGVCLLDISAESIWVAADGSAAFLNLSMAHEFVPRQAERVSALPALQPAQQHAAPEVLCARLAHDVSGRLAPFSGPKADVWAVGRVLQQALQILPGDSSAPCRQASAAAARASELHALISEMTSDVPEARPAAAEALLRCCEMQKL